MKKSKETRATDLLKEWGKKHPKGTLFKIYSGENCFLVEVSKDLVFSYKLKK